MGGGTASHYRSRHPAPGAPGEEKGGDGSASRVSAGRDGVSGSDSRRVARAAVEPNWAVLRIRPGLIIRGSVESLGKSGNVPQGRPSPIHNPLAVDRKSVV